MGGVRLHHPTLRSVIFTITNFAVPLKAPMFCWSCSGGAEGDPATPRAVVHTHKTFHLNIDAVGDVVVAEPIVEMMQRTGLLEELTAMKGIARPEKQVIALGGQPKAPLTVSREHGVLA